MEDFQRRVVAERDRLSADLDKLSAFINDQDKFSRVAQAERVRMSGQLYWMTGYLGVLNARIAYFPVDDEPVKTEAPFWQADSRADFTVDLPRYRSHKVVQAAKIVHVDYGTRLDLAPHGVVEVGADWIEKRCNGYLLSGGYFIVYDDGYTSWSPAKTFEAGYTRVDG